MGTWRNAWSNVLQYINSSDGRVVRASASEAVDSGLFLVWSNQ